MLSWTFAAAAAMLVVLAVPVSRHRTALLAAYSFVALAVVWHVPVTPLAGVLLAVFWLGRVLPALAPGPRRAALLVGCGAVVAGLVALKSGTAEVAGSRTSIVGTSYLALKLLQHLIDAADGRVARVDLATFACTTCFLPTWSSGPIERTIEFSTAPPVSAHPWRDRILGVERIVLGIGKKLVLADPLLLYAQPLFRDPSTGSPGAVWLAVYAFAVGLYLDFSGYSDVAIGVARCAGIRVHENFDAPYRRRNIAQLWQHWHMTLTRWLRDFLFVPTTRRVLRWTKRPLLSQVVGHVVTMSLCGLWHGLTWHFVAWGLYNAVGLSALAAWRVRRGPAPANAPARDLVATVATFHFFAFGLLLFACNFAETVRVLRRLAELGASVR